MHASSTVALAVVVTFLAAMALMALPFAAGRVRAAARS